MSSNKQKKTIKPVNIILNAICILIFVFAAYELIVKFTSNSIYLFGVRSDVVLSDSMSYKNEDEDVQTFLEGHDDQIQKGDLVYSEKVTDKTVLNVYDIVVFKNRDNNLLTIHRIVEMKDGSAYIDGKPRYLIRADTANMGSHDGLYSQKEIIARYKYKIPKIGYVNHFLTSIFGIILEVGIIIIIIVYQFLDDKYFKKIKEESIGSDSAITKEKNNNEKTE